MAYELEEVFEKLTDDGRNDVAICNWLVDKIIGDETWFLENVSKSALRDLKSSLKYMVK